MLSQTSPVIIVGAGVFGLSTAIHLAERGYKHITVFDKSDFDKTLYSYDLGADGASADINKIIRCAYGKDTVHQNLALSALQHWKNWNAEIASGAGEPAGLPSSSPLYVATGNLSCVPSAELYANEIASVENLTAAGHGASMFVVSDPGDIARAKQAGLEYALDPFQRGARGLPYTGILDLEGGFVYADKACRYALHKARALGVKFVLGEGYGTFSSFKTSLSSSDVVQGIKTADGRSHEAELVIIAGGGWTPTLVPELDNLCETTAGSVVMYQIPKDSVLWDRFAPGKFPSWGFAIRDGAKGGLYGFPRDENGVLKIGYRGIKYTNPQENPTGPQRSTPVTRYSKTPMASIPLPALTVIKKFVAENLPELGKHKIPLIKSRLCWYNDSYDNALVIDQVPGWEGLVVATGGSGHAFKYLPVIGRWIADVAEGKECEIESWRWRTLKEGDVVVNKLMEGSSGKRTLVKQTLVSDEDLNTAGTDYI